MTIKRKICPLFMLANAIKTQDRNCRADCAFFKECSTNGEGFCAISGVKTIEVEGVE